MTLNSTFMIKDMPIFTQFIANCANCWIPTVLSHHELLSVRCTSLTGRNGPAIMGRSSTNSICPSTSAWSVYPGRQVLCDDWWRLSRLPYYQRRGQTMFSATMTNHELQ